MADEWHSNYCIRKSNNATTAMRNDMVTVAYDDHWIYSKENHFVAFDESIARFQYRKIIVCAHKMHRIKWMMTATAFFKCSFFLPARSFFIPLLTFGRQLSLHAARFFSSSRFILLISCYRWLLVMTAICYRFSGVVFWLLIDFFFILSQKNMYKRQKRHRHHRWLEQKH